MKYAALALGIAAAIVHIIASVQYGYFRDELYFIACAQHLTWGYVDQPPLVAIAAWLATPFDYALPALRFLPSLAAGGTVYAACILARKLGGNARAEILSGIAAFLLPANLFLGSTLTTTSFEPLTWTLVIVLAVSIGGEASLDFARDDNRGLWLWLGAVIAFALYAKYSIALLVAASIIALLLTRQRRALFGRNALLAMVLCGAAILPNALWQAFHGFPILEVLHNDVTGRHAFNSGLVFQTRNFAHNAFLFTLEQLVFTNPLIVPLWLTGLITLLFSKHFKSVRFIGISYVVLFLAAILLEAKSYYIAGVYPTLCAAGIAFIFPRQNLSDPVRFLGQSLTITLLAASATLTPFTLPILPVQTLIAYEITLGIKETQGNPPRLAHPLFAEEFGWPELTAHVARVYSTLPPAERARTAIFADNYGDAGALNLYGKQYALPPPLSGQNAFYTWSLAQIHATNPAPTTLIAVGATQYSVLRASFREVRMVDRYLHPYRWSAEGPTPIYLCRFPVEPLGRLFARFRWYGA